MIVLGLTGGIASGKTSVARMIAGRGILHLDADRMVHRLMQHDAQTKQEIAALLPAALKGGTIDRAALAAAAARDKNFIRALEGILHPRVRAAELRAIDQAYRQRRKAVLLDVPLLFESGLDAVCDVVIVVQASPGHQWLRAKRRPGMTREKFDALRARQLSDAERAARADIVIRTDIGKGHTARAVEKLLKKLALR